jgi:hypothetical protein
MSTNEKSEEKLDKVEPTVKRSWIRRHTPKLIVLVVILILVLGVRGCVGSSRRSVAAQSPAVELPASPGSQEGIPIYDGDIRVKFSGSVAFVEIVPDDVYQREKSTFLRSLFPGRLLGGEVIFINGVNEWTIEAKKFSGNGEKTYWIRGASHTSTITYKENLDRIIYSLVGRVVDGICGYLPDEKDPGGLYSPDEFHNYAVGQFKAFRMMNQTIAKSTGQDPEPPTADKTVTVESDAIYAHFNRWGLSFDYPPEWKDHPADEVAMMKDYLAKELRTGGRELLEFTMIDGPNDETTLLISKYQIPKAMTPSEFIQERNEVYAEAMRSGDVTKVNHVKETIVANLPAVEEDVERSNGGRGLTLKIINGITVFEISFIVNDAAKFPQYSDALSHLVSTVKLVIQ